MLGTVPGVRWLVAATIGIALLCALVARFVAPADFPTFGTALWWSVQTVTTVGYGDTVPSTIAGRLIAAVLMVSAIAFLVVITASISAGFVQRMQARRAALSRDPVLDALDRMEQRLEELERRLGER
jgi:voltage-gated potassium channel